MSVTKLFIVSLFLIFTFEQAFAKLTPVVVVDSNGNPTTILVDVGE